MKYILLRIGLLFWFIAMGLAIFAQPSHLERDQNRTAKGASKTQIKKPEKEKNPCPSLRTSRHLLMGPIKMRWPEYPDEAKKKGIKGKVDIVVYLNEEGKVDLAWACTGHALLRKAALDAAYKAEFSPIQYKGKFEKAMTVLTFTFPTSTQD